MTSEQIIGSCVVAASALAIAWILSWATDDSKIKRPWHWGDKPRRPGVSIESIVTHMAGVGFLLICGVFALQRLGL
jgi:hypothetical protein